MSATNSHSLQINIYWKLNVNNTSTWTPTTVCSAQPTCPSLRPQRAEPCLHLSRGGWRCAHIPSSHHKKTWSPSSSFKLESDAWWRKTQQSSWATCIPGLYQLCIPSASLYLIPGLCYASSKPKKRMLTPELLLQLNGSDSNYSTFPLCFEEQTRFQLKV